MIMSAGVALCVVFVCGTGVCIVISRGTVLCGISCGTSLCDSQVWLGAVYGTNHVKHMLAMHDVAWHIQVLSLSHCLIIIIIIIINSSSSSSSVSASSSSPSSSSSSSSSPSSSSSFEPSYISPVSQPP